MSNLKIVAMSLSVLGAIIGLATDFVKDKEDEENTRKMINEELDKREADNP